MKDTWCYLRNNGGGPVFHQASPEDYNNDSWNAWSRCELCHKQIFRVRYGARWQYIQYKIAEWP